MCVRVPLKSFNDVRSLAPLVYIGCLALRKLSRRPWDVVPQGWKHKITIRHTNTRHRCHNISIWFVRWYKKNSKVYFICCFARRLHIVVRGRGVINNCRYFTFGKVWKSLSRTLMERHIIGKAAVLSISFFFFFYVQVRPVCNRGYSTGNKKIKKYFGEKIVSDRIHYKRGNHVYMYILRVQRKPKTFYLNYIVYSIRPATGFSFSPPPSFSLLIIIIIHDGERALLFSFSNYSAVVFLLFPHPPGLCKSASAAVRRLLKRKRFSLPPIRS